jgi:hypothetical protein
LEITDTVKSEVSVPPKENGRTKSTLNLQNIFKNSPKTEDKKPEETASTITSAEEKPVRKDKLQKAWDEFAEQRKNQAGEYHILKREFELNDNKITIPLTNPVEEPLLQSIRTQLTAYLRDKLNNNTISVIGVMQEFETKKVAYTNKEKFDHLAEKNPSLRELKERLGLDTDF